MRIPDAQRVHTLLVRDCGVTASYDTLRRFAIDALGWRKKTTTVLVVDGTPGEEAQVDLGLMGTILDAESGRQRRLQALIVTLAVSRYQFVCPSFLRTTEAVCEGLAWTEAKVHPDHHVQVARALYSVPTRFVGHTVRVRADRSTVRIYLGTELVKTNPRVAMGRRSTDASDYPEGKAEYA